MSCGHAFLWIALSQYDDLFNLLTWTITDMIHKILPLYICFLIHSLLLFSTSYFTYPNSTLVKKNWWKSAFAHSINFYFIEQLTFGHLLSCIHKLLARLISSLPFCSGCSFCGFALLSFVFLKGTFLLAHSFFGLSWWVVIHIWPDTIDDMDSLN